MIWASYISPITGARVRWKYPDRECAARDLRYQGGNPDTHELRIEPIEPEAESDVEQARRRAPPRDRRTSAMKAQSQELTPARLSLFDIEAAWLELIQARQEAEAIENPAEREQALAACDQAIAEYATREVSKVDGIRAVCRALKSAVAEAKQERDYQAKRMQSAEALLDRIKSCAQTAMEAAGKKRIDGRTGFLLIRGNGGVAPLEVYDAAMLPDECVDVTITMPLALWLESMEALSDEARYRLAKALYQNEEARETRAPSNARIRAALAEPCPMCNRDNTDDDTAPCASCGGTGRNAVPGARLLERGSHLEIKP